MDAKNYNIYFRKITLALLLLIFCGLSQMLPAQNYALTFDGSSDYINCGNPAGLQITGDQTIEMWLFPYALDARRNPLAKAYAGEGTLTMETDGTINYYYGTGGGNNSPYQSFGTGSQINPNEWTHIAVVRDLSNMKLHWYINGILVNSVDAEFSFAQSGSNTFYIARGYVNDFKGQIDEVRVWNVARTSYEIASNKNSELTGMEDGLAGYWTFNEGSGTTAYDQSPFGHNGTLAGNTSYLMSEAPVFQFSPGNEPFEPIPPTGLPYSIVLDEVLINDGNLPIGAQVGVFDGELCVGTAFFDGNPSMNLVAWQADPGQNLAGFTPGNAMTFKYHTVWYSEVKNFDASADFIQGNGTFGHGTYSVAALSATSNLVPDASLSADLINFNTVVVNQSSTFPLLITNSGNAVLHMDTFENDDSHFVLSKSFMFIAPGTSDTLWITFTPTAVTAYSDMLTLTGDDPDTPVFEVPLYGTGLPEPTPQISVTPSYLDFGGIAMNTSKTIKLNIFNAGNGNLRVTGISSSNGAFSIFGSTSFTLGQGENRNIAVIFSPASAGTYSGNISIQTTSGNTLVPAWGVASQGHFSGVAPTGLPYTILAEDVDIDGFRPKVGDEIAVYDDELCVGVGIANSLGKSLQLDGSGDFLINDNSTDFDLQELTISAWVYSSNFNQNGFIFEKGPVNSQYALFFEGSSINFRTYPTGNSGYDNFYNNSSAMGITNNAWHFITATYDGTYKRLYVDGVLKASQPYTKSLRTGQVGQIIGAYGGSGSHSYYFNGNIDEVRVWDHARTQFEIVENMSRVLLRNEQGLVAYWNFNNDNYQNLVPGSTPSYLSGNANTNGNQHIEIFSNMVITAWEKDDNLGLPGFTGGNPMSFKVFTEIYDSWVEVDVIPDYSVGNGNFGFGQLSVLTLEGTSGLAPDIDVPIQNLYVGQITVGESVVNEIKVYNTGNAPLHIFISDNSDAFTSALSDAVIEANDSLTFEVTFAPTIPGGYTGQLKIESNDPDEPITTVSLEGFALPAGAADISTSVDFINFGNVETETEKTISFFVINTGTTALSVSNIVSNNPSFSVSPTAFTLQNTNDLKEVFVTFTPPFKGAITTELSISSNAAQKQLSLLGVGFDNHFNIVTPTGLPYYIIVEETNLSDYIEAGDELSVFDGNLCVGMADVNLNSNEQSAMFDGSGDYLQVANASALNPTLITVEAWVQTTDGGSSRSIVSKTNGCASSGYLLWLNQNGVGAGKPGFWAGDGPWLNADIAVHDGNWHHIAGTYDGATARIYVDGVLYNSRSASENLTSTNALQIGGSTYCGNYLNGNIDEVRIWNYSLDENEVNHSMSNTIFGNEVGLVGYWPFDGSFIDKSIFGHPTVVNGNTILTNSTPFLHQNKELSITAWQQNDNTGLPGFTPGNAMTFKLWTELNGIPSQLNATPTYSVGNGNFGFGQYTVVSLQFGLPEIELDPMEIFAALNEPDSTVKTLSIHNNGTEDLYFRASLEDDPAGQSLSLDGSNDYVALGNLSPGSLWTVEAWVKPSSTPSGRRAIFGGHGACNDWGIVMSSGRYGVSINPPSECSQTVYGNYTGLATADQWDHVAATCDGTTARLYVNGEFIASAPVLANFSGYSSDVRIGGEACCSGNNFPGLIDEVRLWNYTKSESEINMLMNTSLSGSEAGLKAYWNFNDGTATDISGNGYNGTLQSGATIAAPGCPIVATWVKTTPGFDTVAPGQTVQTDIRFYSEGLNDGLYVSNIIVSNNTIDHPNLIIPITLNVTGNPQIEALPPALDFGQVIVNTSSQQEMSFKNIGTQDLIVDDIALQSGALSSFSEDLTGLSFPLSVPPGDLFAINVSFNPLTLGSAHDTLLVNSNAGNAGTLKVALTGEGITPPEIYVAQTSFSGTFACNDSYNDSVMIHNIGQENLDFVVSGSHAWISGSPSSGSVAGGDSLSIQINISTLDLFAGQHVANLLINSNDPDQPVTGIQYSITVTGDPSILANDFIDLGTGNVGDTLVRELLIANSGCDTLQVNNATIESQHQVFMVNNPSFAIPPGDALPMYISFVPETTFQYSGIINIFSNDPITSTLAVVIAATGVEPPNMEVSPLTLSSTLQSGETDNKSITVQNTGGETLNFQAETSAINPYMMVLDGTGDYINVVHNNVLNPTTALTIEAWIYLIDNTNEFIAGKENSTEGKYRLWVNNNHLFEFKLNNLHSLTSASVAVKNQWTHIAATFDGETMRIFIDGVLDAEQSFGPFSILPNTDNLRIGRSYQYAFFNGKIDEIRLWNIARNQSEIQSTMNQALLGTEPELILWFPFLNSTGNIVSDASMNSNNGILYGNPVRQSSSIPFDDYLGLSNHIGGLTAGQTQNINVQINSTGFPAKDYQREIVVSGNAAENPSDLVALSLTISGTGVIGSSPDQLQFDDTFLGLRDTLELIIENTGALAANITDASFSSPAFYPLNTITKVFPFSQKRMKVVFEPAAIQLYNETLTISLEDADVPQLVVLLSGLGVTPPIPVFSPEQADFGDVVINLTGTFDIELSNQGNSTLEVYSIGFSNANLFSSDLMLPLSLDFGQAETFQVSFTPINYNLVSEVLTLTTNVGQLSIPLSGIGVPPDHDLAIVNVVTPQSGCGLSANETLTVTVQNFGELDQSNFDVGFSINGSPSVSETVSGTLQSGEALQFSFTQKLDLSAIGDFNIEVFSLLANDENTPNDTLNHSITNSPSVGDFAGMSPADSSFGVVAPVSFSWDAVPNALSYDLYIWRTNQQKPNNATVSGITGLSHVYYEYLNKNYLYNWQLVAKNTCSQTLSDISVFSFNVFSDLTVGNILPADTGYSGEDVEISYTISNIGTGTTGLVPWKDDVFISPSQVFDPATAINVARKNNLSALAAGQSYTNTITVNLPDYLGGPYYVFVQTDINNKIQETNENNNLLASAQTMQIILPPYPDLKVSGVQSATGSIMPNQMVSIGWSVENIGDAPAIGGWSQRVSIIAGSKRKILGYTQYHNTLDAGGIISQNSSFTVPPYPGFDGDVFIEVLLTPYAGLVETPNGGANNLAISVNPVILEKILLITMPQTSIDENAAYPIQAMVYRSGYRDNALVIDLGTSEENRVTLPASVTIPANQSGKSFQITPIDNADIEGDIDLEISAIGNTYNEATTILQIIDDESPSLFLSISHFEAGEGDRFDITVTRDLITDSALEVNLLANKSNQIDLPASIIIEANQASASLEIDVVDDDVPELNKEVKITASFPGYISGWSIINIIDDDIPQVELTINPGTVSEAGGPYAAWGKITRLEAGDNDVIIQLISNPTGQVFFPNQITIPGGQLEQQFNIGVIDNGVLDGDRQIEITGVIYLSSCGCGVPEESGGTTTASLTILDNDGPSLSVFSEPYVVAEGLTNAGYLKIARNTLGGDEIAVSITHNGSDEVVIPASAVIPAGVDTVSVPFNTLDDGIEDGDQIVTVTVSSNGYSSGTCWVLVSDRNLPDFVLTGLELSQNEILINDPIDVSFYVVNQGFAMGTSGAEIKIYKSKNNTLDPNDVVLATWATTTVLNVGDSIQFTKNLTITGELGDHFIFATVNGSQILNELVTINNTSQAEPLSVYPDYSATAWVDGDEFNGSTPITINGITETVGKSPAVFKAVDVYVIVNGVRRVFSATSDDKGEFSVNFIPLNGEAGEYTLGACYPGHGLTEAQDTFVLLGAKRTASGYIIWNQLLNQTQSYFLEIKNFSSEDLSNLVVEVISKPAGCNVTFSPIPFLAGNSYATIAYTVEATQITNGTQYEEVKLKLNSAEGTSYKFSAWYYCSATHGNLKIDPVVLNSTMVKGQINYTEFEIRNNGLDTTGWIKINLPETNWMSLASNDSVASLQPGQSAVVTLKLIPGDDLQLNNPVTGSISLSATNANSKSLPFTFEPISTETGDLLVDVVDEYTYNTPEAPHLDSATVVLTHPFTGQIIAQGMTDINGHFLVEEVPEGYYNLKVYANKHGTYQDAIYINKGVVNNKLVFIAFQPITYSWEVIPTQVEDEYEIELVVVFETNVPAPVVIMNMPDTMPQLSEGEIFPFIITLTNEGLITAQDVEIEFPEDEEYMFTANVDQLDILPQTAVQIPCIMERRPPGSSPITRSVNCYDYTIASYKFECGPDDQMRLVQDDIYYQGRICIDTGDGGPGGGFYWWPGGGYGPGGPGGYWGGEYPPQVSTTPITSSNQGCDPCLAELLNALWGCSPIPNIFPSAAGAMSVKSKGRASSAWGLVKIGKQLWGKITCAWNIGTSIGCKINQLIGNTKSSGVPDELVQAQEDLFMVDKGFTAVENTMIETYRDIDFIEKQDFEIFNDSVFENIETETPIDENRTNELLLSFSNSDVTNLEILGFISHWNTTMEAWDSGIYSPTPEYPEIIDTVALYNFMVEYDSAIDHMIARGFPSLDSMYNHAHSIVEGYTEEVSTSVCATVTVQFSQTLTMTREAFEGTLTIFNGHETEAMQNIMLDLEVRDEEGNLRNDLFQINTESLDQISGIDGTGVLDALVEGTAVIIFIPERGAAPEVPKYYSFGGTLSYLDPFTGEMYEASLFPVTLQVNPSPDLYLDYFMQRDIFGDDALTEPIEPMIPAELAVMIDNRGFGPANSVVLESAQPEIIENEKGLLIDFEIIGSNLSGQPVQLGLFDVNFGNIQGGDIAVGQWWFTSTLLGHFISYEASVNHVDSYGNPDLSLVSAVEIHELIKSISVYGPLDDSIDDFLVNDLPDTDDLPDGIYYSNGIFASVAQAESSQVDAPVTLSDTIVELTVTPSEEGWNYTKLNDPGNGLYRIVSCTRDDNQVIPLKNIWLTYSTIPDGGEPIYENKLHFVDTFEGTGPASYTVVFEPIDQDVPEVVAINGIPEGPIDTPLQEVEVVFSEPIEASTFTYEDMTLKNQAGPNLMDTLVLISPVNDSTFTVDISAKTSPNGYYTLTVQAAGVADLVGNLGKYGVQVGWLQTIATPAIDYFFGLPEESGAPIDTLLVLFNMPINTETFTNNQLILEDGDGNNIPTESLVVTSESFNDVLFKISGLAALTSGDGMYTLTFELTEIQGENGQAGSTNQSVEWGVCQIELPTVNAGNNDSICVGEIYQLSGVGENASSFSWSTSGSGSFDDNTILNAIYTPSEEDYEADSFELTLTAEPLNACAVAVSSSIVIHISNLVLANAGTDVLICENSTHQLYGTVENAEGFNWITKGDGSFSNAQQLTPVYTPGALDIEEGAVEIALVAIPASPCTLADTSTMLITIQQLAVANAGTNNTVCQDVAAQLQATVSNYSTLTWVAAGDGTFNSQSIPNPEYTFGTKDIQRGYADFLLIVQPLSPCFFPAFSTVRMTVQETPTAFAGADASVCENQDFYLSGTVENESSFEWSSTGDGVFGDINQLTTSYTPGPGDIANGSLQISLTAEAISPCAVADVSTMNLFIQYLPTADAGTNASICESDLHPLNGSVQHTSTQYWTTSGDGIFDDTQILNPVYQPGPGDISNGSVDLTLVAIAMNPCINSATSSINLAIQAEPNAVAGSDATICEDANLQLNGFAENASAVQWQSSGDGNFDDAGILNAVYTPGTNDLAIGEVVLELVAEALAPCLLSSGSSLNVSITKLATANAGVDASICEDQSHQLSGAVENARSHTWQTSGDGTFDDDQLLNAVYTPGVSDIESGVVVLILNAQSINPCTNNTQSQLELSIQKAPLVSVGDDLTICHNEDISVSGDVEHTSEVFWSTDGDGTFADETSATTSYFPGTDDISTAEVLLTLSVMPTSPCLNSANDALTLTIYHCLDLNIQAAWSGISSYVEPLDSDVETLFANTVNNLIILQSQTGVYWPGQNVNTIGTWNTSEGYSIKTRNAMSLSMVGFRTDLNILSLNTGWSMMPVLSECSVDVATLFTNTDLRIVKEIAGWRVYWPALNINTLGSLQSGLAYHVLMNNQANISFPTCTDGASTSGQSESGDIRERLEETNWNVFSATPNAHVIGIPATAAQEDHLKPGDVVGVFDQNGVCFGATIWDGENTTITVFGDDLYTEDKDGFVDGETLLFKVFVATTNQEYELMVTFDKDLPNADGKFHSNGLSVMHHLKIGATGIVHKNAMDAVIYPNPASDKLYIDFDQLRAVKVSLFDVQGQLVLEQNLAELRNHLDISQLKSGVYLIKLEGKDIMQVERIIKR